MPSSTEGDPMDTSQGMGPPASSNALNGSNKDAAPTSTPADDNEKESSTSPQHQPEGTPPRQPTVTGAAAAVQQPKVVQTAFIHKLYNMLEDQTIQHLISWSSSNESFLISPSSEFAKVLASYFKHTNVSSFVRQLNMYGFHKVSDVFHSGSSDSPLWEFKHGQGNFKRGDLAGLREIKRRASRHTLIHRDSFSNPPKPTAPGQAQPQAPPEIAPSSIDDRVAVLESSLYEMHHRLVRAEEAYTTAAARAQALSDSLSRAYQYTHDLSGLILQSVPNPDDYAHRTATAIQKDISQNLAQFRQESLLQTPPRFATNDPNSVSPRQLAQDDQRLGSLREPLRPGLLRPLAPTGRFEHAGATPSPPSLRPPIPPMQPAAVQPVHQHPLSSSMASNYLSRRHTSADIRSDGWQPGHGPQIPPAGFGLPAAGGASSAHYPSSPSRGPLSKASLAPGDPQLRESLSRYSFGGPSAQAAVRRLSTYGYGSSRPSTPPHSNGAGQTESGFSNLPGARIQFKDVFRNSGVDSSSAPATRKSSLANIHTILNPAETAERDDEDDDSGPGADDWRKRKRLN